MRNPCIAARSIDFFIMAALLGLFGLAASNHPGQHGALQLLLAVLSLGAAIYLRQGTREARIVGLVVGGLTVAVGALLLIEGSTYLPGTIVAIFALFRLGGAPTTASPLPPMPHSPVPPPGPQAPHYGGPQAAPMSHGSAAPFGTVLPGQSPLPPAPYWGPPAPSAETRPPADEPDANPWRAPDR